MEAFKDISVMQGVREFADESGSLWRATYQNGGEWLLFENIGDAYVFVRSVRGAHNAKCKTLFNQLYVDEAQ